MDIPHQPSSPQDQPHPATDSGGEGALLPRLPKVGDFFKSWDDFRAYARHAADARGFSLSQSQSKGSSGTIVLRCSRFKDPGTIGQKMAENGCEVVFKVMKAKNGLDGFEVVQSFEHHNHPYGPNIPTTGPRPSVSSAAQGSQPPPRKKKKKAVSATGQASQPASLSTLSVAGDHYPSQSPGPSRPRSSKVGSPAIGTPPTAAPKPFLFDPYTGKPLRSSTTPVPPTVSFDPYTGEPLRSNSSASTSAPRVNSPSPPSHLDPLHYPPPPLAPPPAHVKPPVLRKPLSRTSSSTNGASQQVPACSTPQSASQPYTDPPPAYPTPAEPAPSSVTKGFKKSILSSATRSAPGAKLHTPLGIRLSVKAQNSITEFLTSLSPAMTAYGTHFQWIGIKSPVDLLEVVEKLGEAEVEMFLDEIDLCGVGQKGEGVTEGEKILIIRGLRKLKSIRQKALAAQ